VVADANSRRCAGQVHFDCLDRARLTLCTDPSEGTIRGGHRILPPNLVNMCLNGEAKEIRGCEGVVERLKAPRLSCRARCSAIADVTLPADILNVTRVTNAVAWLRQC